ncbi:MAG: tRNA 5-methylaminomethyl-2-thiouridine synthase [Bradyrhizobium sp.]
MDRHAMPQYFFHIDGEQPFRDDSGVELRDDRAAWREAMRLARDIETNLSPGHGWCLQVCEGEMPVYRIVVASEYRSP